MIRLYKIGDFPHSKMTLGHQSNNWSVLGKGKEKEEKIDPKKKKRVNYKAYSICIFRLAGFI